MSTDDDRRATPVSFDDRLPIATPEGVEVELTLAGSARASSPPGWTSRSRSSSSPLSGSSCGRPATPARGLHHAQLRADLLLRRPVRGAGAGRTPGKRASGIRVVGPGGRPITFARSAVRNLLRLIDILLGFYAVGMTVIFITSAISGSATSRPARMWSATAMATARRPPVAPAGRHRDRSDLGRERRLGRRPGAGALVPRAPLPPGSAGAPPARGAARLTTAPARRRSATRMGDEAFLGYLWRREAERANCSATSHATGRSPS